MLITNETRKLIKNELTKRNITQVEIAVYACVTERSVRYFFSGRNNSMKIYNACLALIDKHNKEQYEQLKSSYQNFQKILAQ